MKREVYSDKIMVLGVDGLAPRLCKKYVQEGKMPNLKKIIERGAQREDLVLLGSQPSAMDYFGYRGKSGGSWNHAV